MIIAVDFDGTLHTGQWPAIGQPATDAEKVMRKFKEDGHYLIIWTCREGERQTEAINWLLENGIPFDRINDHESGSIEKYGSASRKVYAHLYIDDKQVFGLPAWAEIYRYANELDAKWKDVK